MSAPTLADVLDAHRRDMRALREDLVEAQKASADQVLVSHLRLLKLREEDAARAEDARREARARFAALEDGQRRILDILGKAVEVPASPSRFSRFVGWVASALSMRPANARLLVAVSLAVTLASGLSSLLSACTVAGALHTTRAADDRAPIGGIYP